MKVVVGVDAENDLHLFVGWLLGGVGGVRSHPCVSSVD
jgi:hypothetical protein